jgi:hypothetical protein
MEGASIGPSFKCRSIDGANASTLFKPCASSIWRSLHGIHSAPSQIAAWNVDIATALPAECPSQLGLGHLSMVNRTLVNGHHGFAKPVTLGCTLVI